MKFTSALSPSDPCDALWGAIDKQGRQIILCQYDSLTLGDGAGVEKYGFVDMGGNAVTSLRYDAAAPFSQGVAAVCERIEGKAGDSETHSAGWGAIDMEGNELLPLEYDHVTVRADGIIEAEQGNETLLFDLQGNKRDPTEPAAGGAR